MAPYHRNAATVSVPTAPFLLCGAQTASLVMELLPLVVNVAAELMPEIWTNLVARMQQRMLVELRSTK